LDGLAKRWYENGQLRSEANYKDGEEDGLSKSWHSNGQLKLESNYKDGVLIE
jgi:antitoxin component YwqK of YwqJK toxin-antitoxin module